jgi:hypothetical protein
MHRQIIFIVFLLLLCTFQISAQSQPRTSPREDLDRNSDRNGYDPLSRSPLDGMRARLKLKAEEKEFRENLERAQEIETISNELLKSFETNKTFTAQDKKKLERLEKLVKRVRNASGGDDDDVNVTIPYRDTTDIRAA